jgi:hypothetical protein
MPASTKAHIRDALITAALFGGAAMFGTLGAAVGQAPAPTTDHNNAVQPSTSKPDQNATQEPSSKTAAPTAPGPEIFANGTLTVPGAPTDTDTTPAKFSQRNDALDHLPTMARGPALSDAQRKLIVDTVKAGTAGPPRFASPPATILPLGAEMQAWPQDVLGQIPDLRDTKYVSLADKVLVVIPNSRIVVEEIPR